MNPDKNRGESVKIGSPENKPRRKWKVQVTSWSDMEDYLNDLEDDGYKVTNIFDEKNVEEGQGDDYCLVIAKDQTKHQTKRFY